MQSPENIQIGDRVRILQPDYVAGKIGIVRDREVLSHQFSDRWLVQVDGEDILVSLALDEFQVLPLQPFEE